MKPHAVDVNLSRGHIATAGLVSAGLVLRLLQLLNGRSLWKDEASLAVSIVERSLVQLLTTPLEYNQVAPPLYLVLAKASTLILGSSEFALRLPAFLCSAASVLLFVVLARQVAGGAAFYAALALFAFSPLLVEYAGEAKPYSADALSAVAVAVCSLVILRSNLSTRNLVVAGVTGVVAVLLSLGAMFVVAGAVITLVAFRRTRSVVAVGVAWLAGIALTLWWINHLTGSDTRLVMQQFWEFGFMPFPPDSPDEALWLWRTINGIYSAGFGVRLLAWLFIVATAAGVVALRRQKKMAVAALLISSLGILLLCSAARLYPFHGRLALFVLPPLALLSAIGFASGFSRIPANVRPVFWIAFGLVIFPRVSLLSGRAPASRTEEMKPVVAHVSRGWKADDVIYVFHGATPAMRYYGLRFRVARSDWVSGSASWGNVGGYLRELDVLRGRRRVWVIFSHDVVPGERDAILAHLDTIGSQIEDADFPRQDARSAKSAALLYDLGGA